jgi:hypothetical protein
MLLLLQNQELQTGYPAKGFCEFPHFLLANAGIDLKAMHLTTPPSPMILSLQIILLLTWVRKNVLCFRDYMCGIPLMPNEAGQMMADKVDTFTTLLTI